MTTTIKPSPPKPEPEPTTVQVRLTGQQTQRLEGLVKFFADGDPLGRETTSSDVVRASIDAMYAEHIGTTPLNKLARSLHTR